MAKKNLKSSIILLLLFIFTISASQIPATAKTEKVIIGGEPFGLKLYCQGVMVTKFETFISCKTKVCPAKNCGIRENDIITCVNNKKIKSNEELESIVKNSNGKEMNFEIFRNNTKIQLKVTPLKNQNNEYCLGVWVRDSCAGIGTITYYNPEDNSYGALGHGICDIDTGGLMVSDHVEILSASISSVTKSDNNSIGTLNGCFTSTVLAKVGYNNELGIFGKVITVPLKEQIEVADNSEITTGKATIYSTIQGTEPKSYDVIITQICNYNETTNKNFIFQVTDEELLESTGGIVQGMSGSPIIQNNKMIGAVTHVLLNDPTKGYGIQIENMLNSSS